MRGRFHLHPAKRGKLAKRMHPRGSAVFRYGEQAFHFLHSKDAKTASLDRIAHAIKQLGRELLCIHSLESRLDENLRVSI
jgi:hypothetical protein